MASKARGAVGESYLDRLLSECHALENGRLWWHEHHPPIRGGTRAESGLPDREVLWNGRAYLLEAKEEEGTSCSLGRLIKLPKGVKPDHGVTWRQAEEMDLHTAAGVPCFVVAILTVPYKAPRKRKDGSISDPGYPGAAIARIVPWPTWRALMERAEEQRRSLARWQIESVRLMVRFGPACELPPKPEVQASIPAAELAVMGYPLRSAHELLAALRANHDS